MNACRHFRYAVAALLLGACGSVLAQPANDNFANAEVINTLPFNDSEPLYGGATVEGTDPLVLCRGGTPPSAPTLRGGNTVWYRFTPATDVFVTLSTVGSTVDTMVSVWTGDALANLHLLPGGCSDDNLGTTLSMIAGLRLSGGTTYHVQVSRFTASTAVNTLTFAVTASPVYTVTKLTDSADGTCDADCSLREAVTAANTAPGAIVLLPGAHTLTLAGATEDLNASGDLDLRHNMGLYGDGIAFTLDGTGTGTVIRQTVAGERVFDGPATARINIGLHDFSFTGGAVTGDGGGLRSTGSTLSNIAIERIGVFFNQASALGGGVHVTHAFQAYDSVIGLNVAGTNGGGLSLQQTRPFEIERTAIVANQSAGALATNGGGGLASNGAVRLGNSTLTSNTAESNGGGAFVTTINGSFNVNNSTIAGNSADLDGNAVGVGGGIRIEGTSTLLHTMRNSILADNLVDPKDASLPSDCSRLATATAFVTGNMLVEAQGDCTFSGSGDIVGMDPNLVDDPELIGETFVVPVLAPSPAIDAGDTTCTDWQNRTFATDQRGAVRVFGPRCDLGAYELVILPDELFEDGFESP